jgi:cyclic pyranopterin phosphate synthase
MAGVNDDEVVDFAAKTINEGWHVRFIEFMPTPGLSDTALHFVSVNSIKRRLEEHLGKLEPCLPSVGSGPAKYFRLAHARGSLGFIAPVSEHFCFRCNRLRLTADGKLRACLLAEDELDLKQPLRSGVSLDGLKQLIEAAAITKPRHHQLAEGHKPEGRPMTQVGG